MSKYGKITDLIEHNSGPSKFNNILDGFSLDCNQLDTQEINHSNQIIKF